jgi:TRAP-type C4-dicarboxylate transport system permease small subunit
MVGAAVRHVAWAAAVAAAVIMASMLAMIVLEIVLRTIFDTSTFVLDEFVGYGVAAMTFLALAHTFLDGGLIRVNLLLEKLRGRARRGVELGCAAATLAVSGFAAWYFWISVARHWRRGSVSETIAEVPLWIPYGIALFGLGLFALALAVYVVELLRGAEPVGGEGPERVE